MLKNTRVSKIKIRSPTTLTPPVYKSFIFKCNDNTIISISGKLYNFYYKDNIIYFEDSKGRIFYFDDVKSIMYYDTDITEGVEIKIL